MAVRGECAGAGDGGGGRAGVHLKLRDGAGRTVIVPEHREVARGTSGGRHGQGLAAQAVLHVHRMLHKAFKDAVRRGKLGANPAASVDPPRADAPISTCGPSSICAPS